MSKIKELLDERIEEEIAEIGKLQIASQEKGDAIEDFVKLYKLRIEENKNEMDVREKQEARHMENEREERSKQTLMIEQVKDRYVKIGITSAEIVLPLVFYAVWMSKGFRFEETGAFTSTTFRGLIGKFKPTKK